MKKFVSREFRVFIGFVAIAVFLQFAPNWMSISGASTFFQKYYSGRAVINTATFVMLIYVIRLVLVLLQQYIAGREKRRFTEKYYYKN